MRVRFAAEAEVELDEAADWYAVHGDVDDLDVRFLSEVERVTRLIGEHKQIYYAADLAASQVAQSRVPI